MQNIRLYILVYCISLFTVGNGFSQSENSSHGISEAKRIIQEGSNKASKEELEQAKNILIQFISKGDHQALAEYYIGYIEYQEVVAVYRMDKEKGT